MQENTNKAIIINSLVLYSRLIITMLCGFFTTRFSLQALGVVDYGLFSVLGSIISMIAIINTIMISTSHRFIAVSIGKNDFYETNKMFNMCLFVHFCIAILVLLIALPLGDMFVNQYLNYTGDKENALIVFRYTLIASAITFIGVPYNALLTAKEKFLVFSIPDVISHLIKLIVTYLLLYYFENKILIYTITISILTAYPSIYYAVYCHKKFTSMCKISFYWDLNKYKELLSFSGWVGYGAIAFVGKSQGAAIIVNLFFSTVMNTALGIANMVSSILNNFAQNIAQPISPQITKSYAAGNKDRSTTLLVLSTKLTYLVMFTISTPFFVESEYLLGLWLGDIPEYTVMFVILVIIDTLIESLNSGIKNIIFADGNIKAFQIIPSSLKLISIIVAYLSLYFGAPAYSILSIYVVFTIIIVVANQFILKQSIGFDSSILVKQSYFPCFLVTVLFAPLIFIKLTEYSILNIVISLFYTIILIILFGLSNKERNYLVNWVKSKF